MSRLLLPFLLATLALPAHAQEQATPAATHASPGAVPSPDDRPATQAELKALSEEVRRLKLELQAPEAITFGSFAGMGPGASRVYHQPKGLSIGGYGELAFTHASGTAGSTGELTEDIPEGGGSIAQVLRLVLYVGYRFNDWIVFNSEIEYERGAQEIAIELAYFDFMFLEPLKLRVGNVLVPVGFLNENHEPIFFYGVHRPLVDLAIIPTTWNQNGIGIYGDAGAFRYKAYLLTGLEAFGRTLEAGTWIRGARTGALGPANTWAGVASLNMDVGPATFGGSFYGGDAGQGYRDAAGTVISPTVLLGEVHALVAWKGLTARGIFAWGSLSDAAAISEAQGLAPDQYIGSRAWGGYLEAGYDVLTLVGSSMSLSPFVRFEALNPQAAVEGAGVLNPVYDQRVVTAGIDFKPIPQIAVKADWQLVTNKASGSVTLWDVGIGFVY
jgi:hypothetical protein